MATSEELEERMNGLDQRVGALEVERREEPLTHGQPSPADFLSRSFHGPAFVTDETLARETPCMVYELGERGSLTFSAGMVGPLTAEQVGQYCPREEVVEPTAKQRARLIAMADASQSCVTPQEQSDLGAWVSCMDREVRARGHRL